MRKVIRNTVKFTRNPEDKQDNVECVAAGKYKREDGEALLRSTGYLVDAVDGGLVVGYPEKQATRGGRAFNEIPEGRKLAAVGVNESILTVLRKCAELGRVRTEGAVIVAKSVRAGRVRNND